VILWNPFLRATGRGGYVGSALCSVLGDAEVDLFLTDRDVHGRVSTSAQKKGASTLLFLYAQALASSWVGSMRCGVHLRRPDRVVAGRGHAADPGGTRPSLGECLQRVVSQSVRR
jgi:hypothetical protein